MRGISKRARCNGKARRLYKQWMYDFLDFE